MIGDGIMLDDKKYDEHKSSGDHLDFRHLLALRDESNLRDGGTMFVENDLTWSGRSAFMLTKYN